MVGVFKARVTKASGTRAVQCVVVMLSCRLLHRRFNVLFLKRLWRLLRVIFPRLCSSSLLVFILFIFCRGAGISIPLFSPSLSSAIHALPSSPPPVLPLQQSTTTIRSVSFLATSTLLSTSAVCLLSRRLSGRQRWLSLTSAL